MEAEHRACTSRPEALEEEPVVENLHVSFQVVVQAELLVDRVADLSHDGTTMRWTLLIKLPGHGLSPVPAVSLPLNEFPVLITGVQGSRKP